MEREAYIDNEKRLLTGFSHVRKRWSTPKLTHVVRDRKNMRETWWSSLVAKALNDNGITESTTKTTQKLLAIHYGQPTLWKWQRMTMKLDSFTMWHFLHTILHYNLHVLKPRLR